VRRGPVNSKMNFDFFLSAAVKSFDEFNLKLHGHYVPGL